MTFKVEMVRTKWLDGRYCNDFLKGNRFYDLSKAQQEELETRCFALWNQLPDRIKEIAQRGPEELSKEEALEIASVDERVRTYLAGIEIIVTGLATIGIFALFALIHYLQTRDDK